MSRIVRPLFIRHYRATLRLADRRPGTWYAEYDGIWTVREFVVSADRQTAVAPFDLALRGPGHPTEPPELTGVAPISVHDFETVWEQLAQPRLHALAAAHTEQVERAEDSAVCYFRQPFSAVFKRNEPDSVIYFEYAQDLARRSFEVFADHTLVAPYDCVIPENNTDEMLRAAREGVGPDGQAIDQPLRPEEISHAMFEAQWEQHALARLRALAGLPSSAHND